MDVHIGQLQEDHQHERLCKNQKSKLLQKNLESLRGLIQEIQDDDWKYAADPDDSMASHFTTMDAWGSGGGRAGANNNGIGLADITGLSLNQNKMNGQQ